MTIKMWEEFPNIWKTEASFMAWLRGGVRRGLWDKHPVKLEVLRKNRKRVPLGRKTKDNPEGLVWGFECALCDQATPQHRCQVDHKVGGYSLRTVENLQTFVEGLVILREDDLQVVCKPCHKIKSYSEARGISFEEAKAIKKAIEWGKKPVATQKNFLLENGYSSEDISNNVNRRRCLEDLFKKGLDIKS